MASLRADAEGLRVTVSGVEVASASYHADMQVPSLRASKTHTVKPLFTTAHIDPPDHRCAIPQVCGARGGGDGAAQGMFLALNPQHVFMLALETPHKRNVCIGLIRKVCRLMHPACIA